MIAKLTGDALTWFDLRFAGQDTTVTLEEIALALRNEFGQEYAGGAGKRHLGMAARGKGISAEQ